MSFEHQPPQMNLFNQGTEEAKSSHPKPETTALVGSKVVQGIIPVDLDTGVHQNILEGQKRFAEFFERQPVGKNTYDAFTIIGLDKAANRAQNGNSGDRFRLTRQGRTAEDIRRASERYNSSNAQLTRKILDLAAITTVKAGLRIEYPKAAPEKVDAFVDTRIADPILKSMRYKYLDADDAGKNRRKTASNLKKSIKIQEKTAAEVKAERLGVQRPQRLGNNHYRHD